MAFSNGRTTSESIASEGNGLRFMVSQPMPATAINPAATHRQSQPRFDFAGSSVRSAIDSANSTRASPIECSRFETSRVKQRRNTRRTPLGVASGTASNGGSSLSTDAITIDTFSPSNARFPTSASSRHTPNDQMSLRASTALPWACSGLM